MSLAAGHETLASFVTEKRLGQGEDGDPIACRYPDIGDAVAVFDGMGGAGATQVPVDSSYTTKEGKCSMAYLASRVTSTTIQKVIGQLGSTNLESLKLRIEEAVKTELTKLAERPEGKGPEPRLRGTLLHDYPTTVALAVVRSTLHGDNQRDVKVYWAGDSRIYAFDPERIIPLQVLTRDHTETGGGGDAPVERYASAAGLDLDELEYLLPSTSAVIAMSDGCYAYMTPFKLMLLLVKSLQFSRDQNDWVESVKNEISSVAGDDTSFAISFGEGGFEALKQRTKTLYQKLEPLMFIPETGETNPFILVHDKNQYQELFKENRQRCLTKSEEVSPSSESLSDDTPVLAEMPSDDSSTLSVITSKDVLTKDDSMGSGA